MSREEVLREASILKLRALRERAIGDDSYARSLFRRAAELELAAEPENNIEACGLFLEGGDVQRALSEWVRFGEQLQDSADAIRDALLKVARELPWVVSCPGCSAVFPIARGASFVCACGRVTEVSDDRL